MKKRDKIPSDEIISPAETNVALACCKGWDDKEIADKLHISRNTVIRHKQAIYEKAGIRHTANALVAWFISTNFSINLSDVERRIGAAVLALIFSVFTFGSDSEAQVLRRVRRGRRDGEWEYVSEEA